MKKSEKSPFSGEPQASIPLHRRLRLRATSVSLTLLITIAASTTTLALNAPPSEPKSDAKTKTIRLIIDYGDGVEKHFTTLPWKEDLTVLDALEAARNHPHGITVATKGEDTNSLITQIDDLKNEGGGRTKKNWLFLVNDKLVSRGAGGYKLQQGDAVRWRFGVYQPND